MKAKFLMIPLLAIGLAAGFNACKKNDDNTTQTDSDTAAAEDNAFAEAVYTDAFNVVEDAIRKQPGLNKTDEITAILSGCDSVTVDTTSTSGKKIITIDFGTGCTGNDGKTRSGKIIASLTGRYRTAGTVITTTFDNYYVNGNKVEGTKTVTNKGRNSNNNMEFEIVVSNAKITNSTGSISWSSTRKREWIAGENTVLNPLDDVYLITGAASGTDRKGRNFTVTITKALRIEIGCHYITSGTLEIVPGQLAKRTVDYGNGTCDKDATVTINGKSYNFQMRDR